jgi:hypothetical protein
MFSGFVSPHVPPMLRNIQHQGMEHEAHTLQHKGTHAHYILQPTNSSEGISCWQALSELKV